MLMFPRSSTVTLATAMQILSEQIEGGDGVANAAIAEAGRRLLELRSLIQQAEPIISAQHGAEHMLDGFKLKPRPEIDGLMDAFNRELEQ
jgi:hypothetical protein